MDIFAGTMTGIRNPRAHENDFDNDPFAAVRLLSLADHLLQRAHKRNGPSESAVLAARFLGVERKKSAPKRAATAMPLYPFSQQGS